MKVLFLHPYGNLGDWNHRLNRQVELMKKECELRVVSKHLSPSKGIDSIFKKEIEKSIENFKPDILYISGYLIAWECLNCHSRIVYDMGAYRTRHELLENCGYTYSDMFKMSTKELRKKANFAKSAPIFQKEDEIIKKAKAVIIWEGEEAKLVRKIHKTDNIKELSMLFYDLPKPISWEKKKKRVIAVAAKWGKKAKNGRLLDNVWLNLKNDDFEKMSIGHAFSRKGKGYKFLERDKLIELMNNSRVVFCPYISGGCGVVNEALKLKCNVVTGDWYPYKTYLNKRLVVNSEKKVTGRSADMIRRAMKKRYPGKKMPTEKEQLKKLMGVIKHVSKA